MPNGRTSRKYESPERISAAEREQLLALASSFISAANATGDHAFGARFRAGMLYAYTGNLPAWAARYEPKFQAFLEKRRPGWAS